MNKIFIAFLILTLGLTTDISAQQFKAAAIIGVNASQIDGDSLYGFDKIGLTVGGRLSYENDKVWDVALEMLYSQRGSNEKLFNNKGKQEIILNYLEIPVIFSLRDWHVEKENYYKVRGEAGLSYGYLFSPSAVGFDIDDFNNHDLSWLLGVGLNFTKRYGLSFRYTSGLIPLKKVPAGLVDYQSYFLTLRTEINF